MFFHKEPAAEITSVRSWGTPLRQQVPHIWGNHVYPTCYPRSWLYRKFIIPEFGDHLLPTKVANPSVVSYGHLGPIFDPKSDGKFEEFATETNSNKLPSGNQAWQLVGQPCLKWKFIAGAGEIIYKWGIFQLAIFEYRSIQAKWSLI